MNLHLRNRRRLGLLITFIAILIVYRWQTIIDNQLGHASIFTGSILLSCLVLLSAIGLRKRLVMLPILSVATWMQIHIYTGIFATVVYLFHVPSIIANGIFEGGLSWLFLIVSLSGFYGVYVSRTAPRKMTNVPGEYRFDLIGWHRQRLAEAAAEVLQNVDRSLASPVLADFYRDSLQPYFSASVPLNFVLIPSSTRRKRLLAAIQDLDRYLSTSTRAAAGQLAALVRTRDELDFHYAMQLRLRAWIVVHASLSVILLAWSMLHTLLVIGFI